MRKMGKKLTNDTFISRWILKFNKSIYETFLCVLICMIFMILPAKLFMALAFHYWNELLWVQLLQIAGVAAAIALLIYLAHVYKIDPGKFGEKVKKYILCRKWLILWLMFILCMIISFFTNRRYSDYVSMANALYGMPGRNEGILLRVMEIGIMVSAMLITDNRKKQVILNVLLTASVILSIPVLAQGYGWLADVTGLTNNEAFQYMTEYGSRASVLNYFNHYGYYLSVMILLSSGLLIMDKKLSETMFHLFVFLVNVVTLTVNNTFGGWLASAASILIMAVLYIIYFFREENPGTIVIVKRYQVFKVIAVVILFFSVSSLSAAEGEGMFEQFGRFSRDINSIAEDSTSSEALNAGTGRWRLWISCGEFIQEKPLFGWCEDGIAQKYEEQGFVQDRPANEYLQYAAFYGIPAAILYVFVMLMILVDRLKHLKMLPAQVLVPGGAVMAYLISACFGNTTNYVTMHFFVLLGLAAAGGKNCD